MKFVNVNPVIGKTVITELKNVSPYWLYDTATMNSTNNYHEFFTQKNNDPTVTNMEVPSQLPSGWTMHVNAIRVMVNPANNASVVRNFLFNSVTVFRKNGADIFKRPTFEFQAGAGVNGLTQNGLPSTESVYALPMALQIKGQEPFSVVIDAKDTNFSNSSIDVKVILDGILYRGIATY